MSGMLRIMTFKITSQSVVTALAVVLAVVEQFVPGIRTQLADVTTLAAGLVATGYVHGKLTGGQQNPRA